MFFIKLIHQAVGQPDLGDKDTVGLYNVHDKKEDLRCRHDHICAVGSQAELIDPFLK